jgi:hypothetical protein
METPVEVLRRWEEHGGEWRVVSVGPGGAVVDLTTCHGEAMERLRSDDPELLRFLSERDGPSA